MTGVRMLVVDDQTLIRQALVGLVSSEPGIEVVGEAGDGDEAVRLATKLRPDVVLMDIRMPVLDGIEATRRICADPTLAGTRVLVLTTFEEDENVARALRAGASGFLGKGTDPDTLVNAIRTVHAGEALLSPRATRMLVERFVATRPERPAGSALLGVLTEREREVLALVARGMSNEEITERLVISPHTTKTHVARIMTKLDAHDRAQLVVIAYETGLVAP